MNENKIFVIVKGEDKTKDIEKVEYDCINEKYYIKYLQNYKSYVYKITDVKIEHYKKELNVINKKIYYNNSRIFDVKRAIKYDRAVRIIYENGTNELFFDDENIKLSSGHDNKKEKIKNKYYIITNKYQSMPK